MPLEPALVLGSGFHQYVFGDNRSPLSSWNELIDQTAKRLRIAVPSSALPPTFRWDKLLDTMHKDELSASNSRSKADIENSAKETLKEVLENCRANYPNNRRTQIPLSEKFGSVISLNFDDFWLQEQADPFVPAVEQKPSFISDDLEYRRLFNKVQPKTTKVNGLEQFTYTAPQVVKTIWFPNGSLYEPSTIRMGLHDYGAQSFALKQAFDEIQSWRKSNETVQKMGSPNNINEDFLGYLNV